MGRTFKKIRIFVASPGNVSEERKLLARVVESLNRSALAKRLGLILELLRWETHVAPDLGQPQGVVFDQLPPEDWDIFVGILWSRFGTKTGGIDPDTGEPYQSGTEEEFKTALRRRKDEGTGWPKILLYRCVREVDPTKVNPAQLGHVQEFFRQCETDGRHPAFVEDYKDVEEFERLVREHLDKFVLKYAEKWGVEFASSDRAKEGKAKASARYGVSGQVVMMPGMFRYILDLYVPRLHTWLATRVGLFKVPSEWHQLHVYLTSLRSKIADDIREKTYVEPRAKDLPENANLVKTKREGFLTPIQQVIKEIVGISYGGDAQNAQISAISRKSRFVRNIVKRLLKADEPLILLGDPGTGKTITLQQAALLIAERESKRMFPNVCLFIRLGKFQVSGAVEPGAVWEHVKKSTPPEVRPYLDSLDASGRLVIFFDGMDEMSRARYNEYTTALSVFAGSRKEHIKTLFSCRITDFTPLFQHNRLVLLPFSRTQIKHYLERQIPSFPIKIGGELWSAQQLTERLAQGELPMQADNPFVLWLLCIYLQEERDWPKSRVHLLEYYNRYNYKRKMRDYSRKGEIVSGMNGAFLTWGRVAYEITDSNKGATIPMRHVEQLLAPEEIPAVRAGMHCGVLQESLDMEATLIQFEHHRFQEYFTAFYLYKNVEGTPSLRWLDKLDAPRWQETLFNLVLMGGGNEAIIALGEAIEQGLVQLNEFREAEKTSDAARVETLLTDRVELTSRILQQTKLQSDGILAELFATFQRAAYWLADHGNPITQVKMLLASRVMPDMDIWRVAREPLASDVAWVRQQAQIITSATSAEVDMNVLQEDGSTETLQEDDLTRTLQGDLLLNFASGKFLKRFGYYVRIATTLRQRRLWLVLALGLFFGLAQLVASYSLVAAARFAVVPVFSIAEEWADKSARRGVDYAEKQALEVNKKQTIEISDQQTPETGNEQTLETGNDETIKPGDEQTLETGGTLGTDDTQTPESGGERPLTPLEKTRQIVELAHARFGSITPAILQTLDSWWFLLVGHVAMFLTLLYSLRRPAGHHALAFQSAGYLCLLLPITFWTLWVGHWSNIIFLFVFLLLFVPILMAVGWTLTILAHHVTLALFVSSISLWRKLRLQKRMLLTSMWENCGFASWGHRIWKSITYIAFWPFLLIVAIALTYVDWGHVKRYINREFSWLPAFSSTVKTILGFALLIIVCVVVIACVAALVSWIKKRSPQFSRYTILNAVGVCLFLGILGEVYVGVSAIGGQVIGEYMIRTFGLLPSLPLAVNLALSTILYAEVAGCVVSIVAWLRNERRDWRRSLKGFAAWTKVCLGASFIVLLIWGASAIDWLAVGQFIAATFSLFNFLPSVVNGLLSIAVYIELIGIVVGIILKLRQKEEGWEQTLTAIKIASAISLVPTLLAVLGWGIVALIGLLGVSIYAMAISGRLAPVLAVILVTVPVAVLFYMLARVMGDMFPYVEVLRKPTRYTSDEWKQQLKELRPDQQAMLLRRTTPEALGLSVDGFLSLLEGVEDSIKKEPALSSYWAKRYQIGEIVHQAKIG